MQEIPIYRSTAEFREDRIDVMHDNAKRRARGELPRNPQSEGPRLSTAERFAFEAFPGESLEPYATIRCPEEYVRGRNEFGYFVSPTFGPKPWVELDAESVLEQARAGRFQFAIVEDSDPPAPPPVPTPRPRPEPVEEPDPGPVPTLSDAVWFWDSETLDAGMFNARARLTPRAAIVVSPPLMDPSCKHVATLAIFAPSGLVTRAHIQGSARPRADCWSWPIKDYQPLPWEQVRKG